MTARARLIAIAALALIVGSVGAVVTVKSAGSENPRDGNCPPPRSYVQSTSACYFVRRNGAFATRRDLDEIDSGLGHVLQIAEVIFLFDNEQALTRASDQLPRTPALGPDLSPEGLERRYPALTGG